MNYKLYFTSITLFIYGILMYYLNLIIGVLEFILPLSLYTILFFGLHLIWSKIIKKRALPSIDFIQYFLYRISTLLVFFTILFGGLAYLSNEIYPAAMPEYTISDGNTTVKFQAMSHIGTKKFYKQVEENLIQFKQKGGVYFYEGVKPGTKANGDKFNNAIGVKFDKNLYKNFSKLYGVVNQDNSQFIGLVNKLDFNIDLNLDQIMELYGEKIEKKQSSKNTKEIIPVDANKLIIETLSQLNDRELKILVYINQAILNFIISNETTQKFLTENFSNKDLFEVILGERNKVISNEIINSQYNKIYTTYGLLHFNGVLKLLKENNPKWKIINTKYLYPIKN